MSQLFLSGLLPYEVVGELGFELELAVGSIEFGVVVARCGLQERKARSDHTPIGAGVEPGGLQSTWGGSITLGPWFAFDQAMESKWPQLLAHPALGEVRIGQAEEPRKPWPQLFVGESFGLEAERNQDRQDGLHARVSEAQGTIGTTTELRSFGLGERWRWLQMPNPSEGVPQSNDSGNQCSDFPLHLIGLKHRLARILDL